MTISRIVQNYLLNFDFVAKPHACSGLISQFEHLREKIKVKAHVTYTSLKELRSFEVCKTEQGILTELFNSYVQKLKAQDYKKALNDCDYELALFLIKNYNYCPASLINSLNLHLLIAPSKLDYLYFVFRLLDAKKNNSNTRIIQNFYRFAKLINDLSDFAVEGDEMTFSLNYSTWEDLSKLDCGSLNDLFIKSRISFDFDSFDLLKLVKWLEIDDVLMKKDIADNRAQIHLKYLVQEFEKQRSFLFYKAIEERDLSALNLLLKFGLDFNVLDENGDFPLNFALQFAADDDLWIPIFDALLNHKNLKINFVDKSDNTILHFAAVRNNVELLRKVILKRPTIILNKDKRTAMNSAVLHESLDCIKELFKNYKTELFFKKTQAYPNRNVLFDLISTKNLEILKLVLGQGAPLNECDSLNGFSILHMCVKENWLEGAKLIIDYKPFINRVDLLKRTPLALAIEENRLEFVKLFINNDAKVSFVLADGKTIDHLAAVANLEIFRLIRKKRSMPFRLDNQGNSPLFYLLSQYSFMDEEEFFEKLVVFSHESNLVRKNSNGITELEQALLMIDDHQLLDNFFIGRVKRYENIPQDVIERIIHIKELFECPEALQLFAALIRPKINERIQVFEKEARIFLKYYTSWQNWFNHEKSQFAKNKPSKLFLDLLLSDGNHFKDFSRFFFKINPRHYQVEIKFKPIPIAPLTINIQQLLDFFNQEIDDSSPIYNDPGIEEDTQTLSLTLLNQGLESMLSIISKSGDYIGVPKNPDKKKEFYSNLNNFLRHIVQALIDNKMDQDERKSVLIDLARGSLHCAKRWIDEATDHYHIINQDDDLDKNFKDSLLRCLHQYRLQIITQMAIRLGPIGYETHNASFIKNLLNRFRGIYGPDIFDDKYATFIELEEALFEFDQEYQIYDLSDLTDNKIGELKEKVTFESVLRDVFLRFNSSKIDRKTDELLQLFYKEDFRLKLQSEEIHWPQIKIDSLLNECVENRQEVLKDAVVQKYFLEFLDDLCEKDDNDFPKLDEKGKTKYTPLTSYIALQGVSVFESISPPSF